MLYEFAVEVTNRLEQLDLINSMPKELLTEAILHSKWQTKSSQRKSNVRRLQWLSEEALQIAEERRAAKSKGERERHTQAEFQRIARRPFLNK